MINKLCLGTAQFGLDYGINNKRGRIPEKEVFKILSYALDKGIEFLDTAYDYGDSEKVIGRFIKNSENGNRLKIISKLPCDDNVYKVFDESVNKLGIKKLYGYLIHNFNFFLRYPKIWDELLRLKDDNKIEKIGFSLYYPEEYYKIENLKIDILQIPYSIFDQRFDSLLSTLKDRGIEIYARSVFLQGLIFKEPNELNSSFFKLKDKLVYINSLSRDFNIPLSAIFLNFVLANDNIDKVVIGVDSLENLRINIDCLRYQAMVKEIYSKLKELKEIDEDVILPIKWKK